jgi:hypothetical protein
MMCGPNGKPCALWKHRPEEYRASLEAAGLKFYSEIDITGDVRVALLRGLHNSLNMVANIRKLREPWKAQRFKAFDKELETVIALHLAIERGEAVAMGFYYTKP